MSSAANDLIRFVCPNCKMQLTVDRTLAGVTGPCPSCGSVVTAPNGAPSEPAAISVQPRPPRQSTDQAQSDQQSELAPRPVEPDSTKHRAHSRPGHSVNPRTGLSADHEERQELRIVLKMFIAGIVVAAVVAGVVIWLRYR